MIIEQQQILTTQNLAVLYSGLELNELLEIHSVAMAKQCATGASIVTVWVADSAMSRILLHLF